MGILSIIVIIAIIALAVMIFTKEPTAVEAPAETTTGGRADGGDQGGSTVWSESHLVRA